MLLHEGLGCLARWRDFPERLAERTRLGVLAYSRYGYGHSSPVELPRPLDYMTREAAEVLPEVIEFFQIRNLILIGHSDGGSIATIYAARVTSPRAMVLIAPHFYVEDCSADAIRTARHNYLNTDLPQRLARYHDDVEGAFRGWCDAWLDDDFIANWNIEDDIDNVRCPVLALQGANDPYGSVAQYRRWRNHDNFNLQLLEGLGHDPLAEQPEETLNTLADYILGLPAVSD